MKILQGNLGRLQIQTTDYTCAPTSFLNITIATLNTGIILNDAGIVVNMDELSFAQALGCTGRE